MVLHANEPKHFIFFEKKKNILWVDSNPYLNIHIHGVIFNSGSKMDSCFANESEFSHTIDSS